MDAEEKLVGPKALSPGAAAGPRQPMGCGDIIGLSLKARMRNLLTFISLSHMGVPVPAHWSETLQWFL